MLYGKNTYSLLTESAAADFLTPETDPEVKEVLADLQDELTTNVEVVDADDKVTNGVDLTVESCPVYESNGVYAVNIRDILRICEAEAEAEGAEEPVDAGQVASDVAEENDLDKDQLVIVAPVEVAEELIECCLFEAKCGKKGRATKKAKGLGKALAELKAAGFKVKTRKKK